MREYAAVLAIIHVFTTWMTKFMFSLHVWSSLIGWHLGHGVRSFSCWLCWLACCTELQHNASIKAKAVISAMIHSQNHLWTCATTNTISGGCSTLFREHLQFLWLWHTNTMIAVSQTKHGTGVLEYSTSCSHWKCFSSPLCSLETQNGEAEN